MAVTTNDVYQTLKDLGITIPTQPKLLTVVNLFSPFSRQKNILTGCLKTLKSTLKNFIINACLTLSKK